MITREAFYMFLKKAGRNYDNFGLVSQQVLEFGAEEMLKEVEWVHHKCLESRLD